MFIMFFLINLSDFIYQAIGIVGLVVCVLSFQFKSNKTFLIMQAVSCLLFAVQFYLAGAWVAFILNSICVVRSILYIFIKGKRLNLFVTILLCVLYVTAMFISIFIFNEVIFIAILCTIGSLTGTITIATDNNKIIRYFQLGIISPCWLVNNIFYLSIGGIIAETFNMVSALIALIRWRLLEKKEK